MWLCQGSLPAVAHGVVFTEDLQKHKSCTLRLNCDDRKILHNMIYIRLYIDNKFIVLFLCKFMPFCKFILILNKCSTESLCIYGLQFTYSIYIFNMYSMYIFIFSPCVSIHFSVFLDHLPAFSLLKTWL